MEVDHRMYGGGNITFFVPPTMEVDHRVYGGGNITFFDPPPKLLIHYYISTMIHLHYNGGGS